MSSTMNGRPHTSLCLRSLARHKFDPEVFCSAFWVRPMLSGYGRRTSPRERPGGAPPRARGAHGTLHAGQGGREPPAGHVDAASGDFRVARRRIDVSPALLTRICDGVHQHAPPDRRDTVHARDRLVQRHFNENGLKMTDFHGHKMLQRYRRVKASCWPEE